jgi:hypothetical protein
VFYFLQHLPTFCDPRCLLLLALNSLSNLHHKISEKPQWPTQEYCGSCQHTLIFILNRTLNFSYILVLRSESRGHSFLFWISYGSLLIATHKISNHTRLKTLGRWQRELLKNRNTLGLNARQDSFSKALSQRQVIQPSSSAFFSLRCQHLEEPGWKT